MMVVALRINAIEKFRWDCEEGTYLADAILFLGGRGSGSLFGGSADLPLAIDGKAVCSKKEWSDEDGTRLKLFIYRTDDPSILSMMRPYAGMKLCEILWENAELTITV